MSSKDLNSETIHHDHHERHFLGNILDDPDCLPEGMVDDHEEELVGIVHTQLLPSGTYPTEPLMKLTTYQALID